MKSSNIESCGKGIFPVLSTNQSERIEHTLWNNHHRYCMSIYLLLTGAKRQLCKCLIRATVA